MSDIPDFPLEHTFDGCVGLMEIAGIRLTLTYEVYIYGTCKKCHQSFAYTIKLTSLYKVVRNYRKAEQQEHKPLRPPLQAPAPPEFKPAEFTEADGLFEAHGLSVIIPPDEATQ